MDFSGKLMLAFLEEDNPRRGLFHVRPLLTQEGPISQSDIDVLRDDGFLRIAPDKNEQYTFKDRMRTLGSLCLIDLREQKEASGKLRPNRNYNPSRGETHQFILYSDTVQPLPERLVFEVVAGKPGAPLSSCLTPCCYLREGGHIEGPYLDKDGSQCGAPAALRPDSTQLFSIAMPDGQERLFYWPILKEEAPKEEKAPEEETFEAEAPKEPLPEEKNAPLKEASAMDKIRMMDDALPELENTIKEEPKFRQPEFKGAPKLTGTPIYHVTAQHEPIRRAHNELHAVVGRYAAKRPKDGEDEKADVSSPKQFESPVDVFKKNLDALWNMPGCQEQVIDYLLSRPSAPQTLLRSIMSSQDCTVYTAMNRQLEDLEAERLSLIMQIDKAKEDKQKLLSEALDGAEKESKEGIEALNREREALQASLETLTEQQHTLLSERQQLLDELEALGGPDTLLAPQKGEKTTLDVVAARVLEHVNAFGLNITKDEAMHAVVLLILFDQVQVISGPRSDAFALCKVLSSALGAECTTNIPYRPLPYLAGGDGPAVSIEQEGTAKDAPYLRLIPGNGPEPMGSAYALSPWPCLLIKPDPSLLGKTLPKQAPISLAALRSELQSLSDDKLPDEAFAVIEKFRAVLSKQGISLPRSLCLMLMRYLSAAANVLDGGIAAALDFGISSFLLPYMRAQKADCSLASSLVGCLPKTAQWL